MIQDDKFNADIAQAYEQQQPYRDVPHPPAMLIFSAIPGSGKTTLAKRLVHDLQAQYINHDDMRDILRRRGIAPEGIFMPPISRIVINNMVNDKNKFVVIDVSLDRRWDIFYAHVKELNALPIVIRLNPPIEVIRKRLLERDGPDGTLVKQLDRFKREFDNCCEHVKADVTIGENYDYGQVLNAVKDKLATVSA